MHKKQKKQTKNVSKKNVGRMPPIIPQRKVVPLEEILNRVYTKEDLSTTCVRGCTCCRVACPQMKFSEATSIIDNIWATWTKSDKKKLLLESIKYFFSDSLIKPCLMLEGQTCRVYKQRPLNCRLYGLWPAESWENRVAMFSKSTGLPKEKLPLNTQCTQVKRCAQVCKSCLGLGQIENSENENYIKCEACGGTGKINPPALTSAQIGSLFEMLDKTDKTLGISDLMISESWNYRTFHDWVLLKFWGDQALSKWTSILLDTSPEQRQSLMEEISKLVEKMDV